MIEKLEVKIVKNYYQKDKLDLIFKKNLEHSCRILPGTVKLIEIFT